MSAEMESLQPGSRSSLNVEEEEDQEFYERIEAPKFVDFTIPDRHRIDDKTWFCARIGCDQNHEEVDPDALYRSFKLRVMAARSPNVRFQRTLNIQRSGASMKCPQSAPAKSVKNPISRMSSMKSDPEKIVMTKLKRHPITSLRETPIQRKVTQKAQTTPMNKVSQVQYLKEPVAVVASKDKNVAKDHFSHTPKRAAVQNKTPLSEICSEMKKKLNTNGERNRTLQSSYATTSRKCKGSSVISMEIRSVGSKNCCRKILKVASHNELRNVEIGAESNGAGQAKEENTNLAYTVGKEQKAIIDSKIGSYLEGLIKPSKDEVQYTGLNISTGISSEIKTVFNVTDDDDKENTLFTSEKRNARSNAVTSETKSSLFEICDHQTQQEVKAQNKSFHGVKHRRTTNPKPFRLRTDERGILKEANMERRLQIESKKEAASLIKNVDGIQTQIIKGKAAIRSQNKSFKNASPKQLLKNSSATKATREPITLLNKVQRDFTKLPELKQAIHAERRTEYLQGKKPTTVPKEPRFQKFHVPKNCIRRSEMAVS